VEKEALMYQVVSIEEWRISSVVSSPSDRLTDVVCRFTSGLTRHSVLATRYFFRYNIPFHQGFPRVHNAIYDC
jgi:hypothetical protein